MPETFDIIESYVDAVVAFRGTNNLNIPIQFKKIIPIDDTFLLASVTENPDLATIQKDLIAGRDEWLEVNLPLRIKLEPF